MFYLLTIWLAKTLRGNKSCCTAALIFLILHFQSAGAQQLTDSVFLLKQHLAIAAGRYEEAIDNAEKFYAVAESTNDANAIFHSLVSMMDIYCEKGDYEKSFHYAGKLMEIADHSGNQEWLMESLMSMGRLNALVGNNVLAGNYFRQVLTLTFSSDAGHNDAKRYDGFYLAYGNLLACSGQFDSARYYYQLLSPVAEDTRAAYEAGLGEFYYQQGRYEDCRLHNENALMATHLKNDLNIQISALIGSSKASLALGQVEEAMESARAGLKLALDKNLNAHIRDCYYLLSAGFEKLHRPDSSDAYFRKYTTYKDYVWSDLLKGRMAGYEYEKKLAAAEIVGRNRELQLQKEAIWRKSLMGAILLLAILVFMVVRVYRLRNKNQEKKRIIAENNLSIQALEAEKTQAEWQEQRRDLELKALKAQMNPHFIFNCLNSINGYIIRNKSTEAADYLTKFAKLTRMVLENSSKSVISLRDDLQALKWYMDLENTRFEKPFIYTIDEDGLNCDLLMIPPLVIQPFVENAIWHGLHQMTERQGIIEISLCINDNLLQVEIRDNGGGRLKSEERKRFANSGKVSMGIDITTKRLQMTGNESSEKAVVITDIIEEDGSIGGTSVKLKIPVNQFT
jgi:tetratricopeptide (TPR) repeat protein